jgi:hypothetical protein
MTVTSDATDTATPNTGEGAKVIQEVVPTGGGYRAVIKRDGDIIWSCSHVHFTEHSARSCPAAAQRLAAAA